MTVPRGQHRISTGVPGWDDIGYGGLLPERGYKVVGEPLHNLRGSLKGTPAFVSALSEQSRT